MRNLLVRSISGLIYVIIFISAILYSPKSYIALMSFFAVVCVYEFSKIIKLKNILPFIILIGFIYITTIKIPKSITSNLIGFSLMGLSILLYLLVSSKTIKTNSFNQKLFLHIIYIILPFFFLIKLPFINNIYEPNIIIYIILLIWVNDSFAFIIGKNFGKNKLFESVSPKKTIEGFIGGLVFSILTSVLIGFYNNYFSIINWVVIAIIVSVFGSLGDLVESKFKRQAKVKDSGTIMPGHGGLLDRLDSLFFLSPFVYLYIYYII